MRTYLTIKNYRCFLRPVTVEISRGFTSFVGVNNAGKSAIMRFLLEFRTFLQTISNAHLLPQLISGQLGQSVQPDQVLDGQEIFSNRNSNPIEFSIKLAHDPGDRTNAGSTSEEEFAFTVSRNMMASLNLVIDSQSVRGVGAQLGISNGVVSLGGKPVSRLQTIIEVLLSLASTLYIGPFRNTINAGAKTDYLDIQIGQSFITQFRELKTGNSKKQNLDISTLTEEIRRIFRFDSLDISPTADNLSLHLTVNGKAYKQHEVGSGLAQFVIVLANAAIKGRKWILIDEPELNLHPALQLDFLTALGKYAQEGVWYSTHSVGLARSAASRVYSVLRMGDGDSDIRPLASIPSLAEFLGEMSFSSHKELGFEKILLVEGPTEVPAIQQFLRLLGKDRQILLLPLHGHMPKAEELEETLRISTNISALVDSEKTAPDAPVGQDRQDFLSLCQSKGLKCHILERRAIENYFPEAVVKRTFGAAFRSLTPYEKLSDANPHWGKSQNWKMAADMTLDDISETDLGQFLKSL